MDADSYFLNKNYVSVDKKIENRVKLSQIVAENVLNIGQPNHQENHLSKFLKGFVIQNDGSIEATTHTLCSFQDGYAPSENDPHYFHEYETSLAFSSETVKRQCSGVNAYSVSLSTPWVNAEAEYKDKISNANSNNKIKSYLTTRSVYNKKNVDIDVSKLRINAAFESKLKEVIENNTDLFDQCTQMIRVLNRYGWYIVTRFSLGGGFYVTEEMEISSFEEAEEQEKTAKASAGGKFFGYGLNAGYESGSTSATSYTSQRKNKHLSFNQIGGGGSAHESSTQFEEKLNDESNWRIIRYDYFIPSLVLLQDHNIALFTKTLNILAMYYDNPQMKNLQPKINIRNYLDSLLNVNGNENYNANNYSE